MKLVVDPEAPTSCFQVDREAKRVIPARGAQPVLSPFDENALEAALKIRDTEGAKITVISMGQNLAKPVVKKSLAVGADELITLEDPFFAGLDAYSTAHVLAAAIKKMGGCDLILCGRQASDTNAGLVGSGIAEILGIPSVTVARRIEAGNGKVMVERLVSDGYEMVEAPMPALVTASSEIGELRPLTVMQAMAARKKEVVVWNAEELGVDPSHMKRTRLLDLYQPVHEVMGEVIGGETAEQAAVNLALKLREAKII